MSTDFSGEIATSIRMELDDKVEEFSAVIGLPAKVELIKISKPYATVQFLFDTNESLAVGNERYDSTYSLQVGVFARDLTDRYVLQQKVKHVLQNPNGIPLRSISGIKTDRNVELNVNAFTPMGQDDAFSESTEYRGYFDVNARILSKYGEDSFTQ